MTTKGSTAAVRARNTGKPVCAARAVAVLLLLLQDVFY